MDIGTRMTIARLDESALVLRSPVPIDAETESQLRVIGSVRFVVAPNLRHCLYVADCHRRFPAPLLGWVGSVVPPPREMEVTWRSST